MCGPYDDLYKAGDCLGLYHSYIVLLQTVCPFLLVIGTVGNILSLIVLRQRTFKDQTTFAYLEVLAVADTLVLYLGLLPFYLQEGYCLVWLPNWLCKLQITGKYVVTDFSVYLIVAVTVERFISVVLPMRNLTLRKPTYILILCILMVIIVLHSHMIYTYKSTTSYYQSYAITVCDVERFNNGTLVYPFYTYIWSICDLLLYSVIPFTAITVLNTAIIIGIIKRPIANSEYNNTGNASLHEKKITIMLLTISFVFLTTTLPVSVNNVINTYFLDENEIQLTYCDKLKKLILRAVFILLMYLNHSINMFLYLLTGQKFRKALFWLLRNIISGCGKKYNTRQNTITLSSNIPLTSQSD